MAKELTALAVENFKPAPKRVEILDGRITGLRLVIQPNGKRSWAFRFKIRGKSRKLTIGVFPEVTLRQARDRAGRARNAVEDGRDPCAEKKAARTALPPPVHDLVETVVEKFLFTYGSMHLKTTTARAVRLALYREIVTPWRGRRLSEIKRADVHDLLDAIVERGSPISANRTLSWLRLLCGWAITRGLLEVSPCAGIKPPSGERSRDRILDDNELRAVWLACEALRPVYGSYIKTLILTGGRRNEIAQMRWTEVNFETKTFTLPALRSKNGREHALPLSDAAVDILKDRQRECLGPFVFALSMSGPIRNFYAIKRYLDDELPAAIPPWHFHDLRRTFASGGAKLGVQPHVIEAALNHRGGSIRGVAAVYNRYAYSTEQRTAFTTWARHVGSVIEGVSEPTNVVLLERRP